MTPSPRLAAVLFATIVLTALAGCTVPAAGAPANELPEPTATAEWCPEGDDGGVRSHDLAELVHDTAMGEYLRRNVLEFGRIPTPQDQLYALMPLQDQEAYSACITAPESCLRAQLRRTDDETIRKQFAETAADDVLDAALDCLQKAGDAYARQTDVNQLTYSDTEQLDQQYRQIMLHHIIGNMMPVALLTETDFYGETHPQAGEIATRARDHCYERLSEQPLDPAQLVPRISQDTMLALRCTELMQYYAPSSADTTPAPEYFDEYNE